jgi:hypothetical protein
MVRRDKEFQSVHKLVTLKKFFATLRLRDGYGLVTVWSRFGHGNRSKTDRVLYLNLPTSREMRIL